MTRVVPPFLAAAAVALATAGPARADDKDRERHTRLLQKVSAALVARCDGEFAPPPAFHWPPAFEVVPGDKIGASARAEEAGGKFRALIRVTAGMMDRVIEGEEDRLALVVGHELGHVLRRHVLDEGGNAPFLEVTFSRRHEFEADEVGVGLLLRAGYSLERGLEAMTRLKELRVPQSSFEALAKEHPTWDERLARLDKDRAHVWRNMAAFQTGVLLLTYHDYANAETCFRKVLAEFPECYEAGANLGYSLLMQYVYKLPAGRLRKLDVGQLVTVGYYDRPRSIRTRDTDEKLFFDALGHLRDADRLAQRARKPRSVILNNLGFAHLVHPHGRDVGESTRCYALAAAAAKEEAKAGTGYDPRAHAALTFNAGVAAIAQGDTEKGFAQLDEAEKMARGFAAPAGGGADTEFEVARLHNRATALANGRDRADREKAVGFFEQYLRTAGPQSLWWEPAYQRYAEVCEDVGTPAKARDDFTKDRPLPVPPVTGLKLKSGETVLLGETDRDVVKKLGPGVVTAAVPDTDLRRLVYEREGVEFLVTNGVLAIALRGPDSPTIPIPGGRAGAVGLLRVGMAMKEAEQLLGGRAETCQLVAPDVRYRYFRDRGVAVREADGKVVELVVVQVP
jgi:tetratricopeptide (TPR) repeat protein